MLGRKLNLLFICGPLAFRGTTLYSLALATELKERGHNVHAFAASGPLSAEFLKRSIPLTASPTLGNKLADLLLIPKLARRAQKFNPQIIHCQTLELAPVARKLASATNTPCVLTAHNIIEEKKPFKFPHRLLKKVIAISEPVRESLVNHTRIPKELVTVIPTGVDLKRLKPSPPFSANTRPVVGAFGPLEPVRGIHFFLKAAKEILAVRPDTHFLIVGEGPEEKPLKKLAAELGITNKTTFCAETQNVFDLYKTTDIFVMPSLSVALGTIILQAMACGKPVIASAVGGAYYVIKENETGFLVPKSDSAAICDRVIALLDNHELARTIGSRARLFVEQNFSAEKMVVSTVAAYIDALENETA